MKEIVSLVGRISLVVIIGLSVGTLIRVVFLPTTTPNLPIFQAGDCVVHTDDLTPKKSLLDSWEVDGQEQLIRNFTYRIIEVGVHSYRVQFLWSKMDHALTFEGQKFYTKIECPKE